MSALIINTLIGLVGLYVAIGFLWSIPFVLFWVGKIDPAAKNGSWGFRIVIIPGLTIFWPIFLIRLLRGVSQPPVETNAHRKAALTEPVAQGSLK